MPLLSQPNINIVKVTDCLEYCLNQLGSTNSLAGPYVVDRSLDPRLLKQDKISLYRQLGRMIQIKSGSIQLMDGSSPGKRGTLGGVKRKKHRIEMLLSVTLNKEQDHENPNLYIDSLLGAAIHDIEWGVVYAGFVKTASVALNSSIPSWGQAPSCINPLLTHVIMHPQKHPSGYASLLLDYMFDEYGPSGDSGLL